MCQELYINFYSLIHTVIEKMLSISDNVDVVEIIAEIEES